jgi:hypothetical protein
MGDDKAVVIVLVHEELTPCTTLWLERPQGEQSGMIMRHF